MKYLKSFLTGFWFILLITFINAQENNLLILSNPYIGQKPPGDTPEIFAPDFVSTEYHEFSCTMAPDGKTFYFTRRVPEFDRNRIMVTYWEEGDWTKPCIDPKISEYEAMEPHITFDGSKFFFQSWKSFEGNTQPSMDIWMMEKKDDKWGDFVHMDYPFNPGKAMYICMAKNQTIYTTDISKGFNPTRIVFSKYIDGKYQEYQSVGDFINSTGTEIYPCVSPDESFLLFVRASAEHAKLYVSFRQDNDRWGEPVYIDLGLTRISMPALSPDGKYLFFTSSTERLKGDIYWISTKIINDLKPKELK